MDISKEQIAELVKRALLEIDIKEKKEDGKGEIPVGVSNRHTVLAVIGPL